MNQREALLAAAEQIEKSPGSYNFGTGSTPRLIKRLRKSLGDVILRCPDTACALGWVAEISEFGDDYHEGASFLGTTSTDFYGEMDTLTNPLRTLGENTWYHNPPLAAKGLRLYADKHFPAPKEQAPPDWNALAQQPYSPTIVDNDLARLDVQTV